MRSKLLDLNKPVYFNLMLCGKSETGKSEFLKRFMKDGFNKDVKIKKDTDKITEYVVEKKDGDMRYVMTAIECPGYGADKSINEWYATLKDFLVKKVI